MENIIKCSHPKMTGKNDQQDESLTGQVHHQAGHRAKCISDNYMENIIKCSHPKMTGQNDRQDESLTHQVHD